MRTPVFSRPLLCAALALLAACGGTDRDHAGERADASHAGVHEDGEHADGTGRVAEADTVRLTAAQVAAAGIELALVRTGTVGAIAVPATIVADPERSAVVATSVGGRVTAVARNIGERVRRGDVLAVIESQEAAGLQAGVDAARQQLALAESTLRREEALFRERVSPEQDVLAARSAAAEARIRLRLARQQLGAAGGSAGGESGRLVVRAPVTGHVIARSVTLGEVVAANAQLFRVADLSDVAVELALPPDAAARIDVGAPVTVATGSREAIGRIAFLSSVIDEHTRQVRSIAMLPNAEGQWRVGETVQASVPLGDPRATGTLAVPKAALQTVEDKPSVFVRTPAGFVVRHLVTGPTSGDMVTVISGLRGGERIATTNSYVLKAELGKGEGGEHAH